MKTYSDDELKEIASGEVLDLLEEVIRLNDDRVNGIVILNQSFHRHTLAAMFFSKMYSMGSKKGYPELNMEVFNRLPKNNQVKEITATIDSLIGFLKAMEDLNYGIRKLVSDLGEIFVKVDLEEFKKYASEVLDKI